MKFLIKYATRGRPEWFKKTIQNITETISKDRDYLILVSADINDISMNVDRIKNFCAAHPKIKLCFGNSQSKIQAINADMDQAGNWDILVNMSDDMKFIVPGWDKIIERDTKRVWPDGDFFAHYNDGYVGDRLPTMSIMDKKYYLRDGYIYYPGYKSFSSDAEAYYVAIMRGRHKYFPEILFLHQHPANTPSPKDETYRINSLHTPHDTKLYFERLNRYFDIPPSERTCVPFQQHLGRTA